MTNLRLALILILCAMPPAVAQDTTTPDLVVETAMLHHAQTGKGKPFAPDSEITASVTLHNRGNNPLTLHRIVLNSSAGITVIDPASDGLDNDADGQTDETDEAFGKRDGESVAWMFSGDGQRLAPGGKIAHTFRIALARSALPGTTETLTLTAGSTRSGDAPSRPQKTRHDFSIPVTPPVLTLTADETQALVVGGKSDIESTVILPSGILPALRITLDLPPAMTDASIKSYRIGSAIDCDNEMTPAILGDKVVLELGQCDIGADQPADDRAINLQISSTLSDASAEADDAALDTWRELSIYLGVWSGDTLLGATVRNNILHGPRPVVTMTLPEDKRYRVGDPLIARVSIANRGDRPLVDARLRVLNGESFLCRSVTIGTDDTAIPCVDNSVTLPGIDADEALDLGVTLALRDDALIEGRTGPQLDLVSPDSGVYTLPVPPITLALHDAPVLTVADHRDWQKQDTITTATIGDRGRLRLEGTLPPGRYPGQIRVVTRTIDALTGAPVSPATVTILDPDLSMKTMDGETIEMESDFSMKTGTLWTQQNVAFDLREASPKSGQNRRFVAEFDVLLADDPAIKAGHILEIGAETIAYGGISATSNTWVELLIQEPDLRLKTFSLDDDRIIRPEEIFGIASLVCNYGDSPAYGASMTLDVANPVDLLSDKTNTDIFTVPLDTVRSGSLDRIGEERDALKTATAIIDAQSVAIAHGLPSIDPDQCIGLELQAPLKTTPADVATSTSVLTSLSVYTGHSTPERARTYPTRRTSPVRFQIPVISIGPSSTIHVGSDRQVTHPVDLSVPDYLGPFRIALLPQSSTKLDWVLFENQGDQVQPWLNNAQVYSPGSTVGITMQASVPESLPLGWVDTTRLNAEILTDDGRRFAATLRLVIRTGVGSARAIATEKLVALDRDCDGILADERVQDAVFEQGKDATPGDCLIIRIGFENIGLQEVERIVIRDVVSTRTTLLPDSATVRITPEPLEDVIMPNPASETLEWEFEGLFRPGAVGEVEYRLRLDPL